MAPEIGAVRIDVAGPMRSLDLRSALRSVEQCHSGLFLLDQLVEEVRDVELTVPPWWWREGRWRSLSIGMLNDPRELSDYLPLDAELVLLAAEFASPGFLEFLGSLNPLTAIREYLKDRHERKKDKQYRNAAEGNRLNLENERFHLENEALLTTVLSERVDVLRSAGLPEPELNLLVRQLVVHPFHE